MSKFTVKLFNWIEGKLHHHNQHFSSRIEAQKFADEQCAHQVKILKGDSVVLDRINQPVSTNTYA